MKWKEKAEVERYCSHSARFSSHIEREREQDKEKLVDHLTPSSADFQLLLLLLVMMIMVWPLPISPFQFVVTGLLHLVLYSLLRQQPFLENLHTMAQFAQCVVLYSGAFFGCCCCSIHKLAHCCMAHPSLSIAFFQQWLISYWSTLNRPT